MWSRHGGATSKGTPTYYSAKFPQKVFKSLKNWAEGGRATPCASLSPNPPMVSLTEYTDWYSIFVCLFPSSHVFFKNISPFFGI